MKYMTESEREQILQMALIASRRIYSFQRVDLIMMSRESHRAQDIEANTPST